MSRRELALYALMDRLGHMKIELDAIKSDFAEEKELRTPFEAIEEGISDAIEETQALIAAKRAETAS